MEPDGQDSHLFKGGIFRNEKTAWISLAVYTTLLYSTLTLTNDLYRATFDRLGKSTVSQGIYAIASLIALALLIFMWLRLPRTPSTYATAGIIGLLIYYAMSIEYIPANRIHFFSILSAGNPGIGSSSFPRPRPERLSLDFLVGEPHRRGRRASAGTAPRSSL